MDQDVGMIETNGCRDESSTLVPVKQNRLPLILVVCLMNLLDGGVGALLAPFYPLEAQKKDLSPTQYGLVLGMYQAGLFLFTPTVAPFVISRIGLRNSMSYGMVMVAVSSIAFAFIDVMPAGMSYFLTSLVLQIFRSIGSAAAGVAMFAHVMYVEDTAKIFPLMELFFGLGLVVGPGVGGLLYQAGGFAAPFLASAGAEIVTALIVHYGILEVGRDDDEEEENPCSPLKLLSYPTVILTLVISIVASLNIGFTNVTQTQHVQDIGLEDKWISILFVICGVVYVISTQVSGYLIDRWEDQVYFFLMGGFILSLATYLLSGPMYPLTFETNIGIEVTRQVLYGLSMGPQMVGSFTAGKKEVDVSPFGVSVSSSSAYSSLFQSAYALGSAVGPPIGGSLMHRIGYSETACVFFVVNFFTVFVLLFLALRFKWTSNVQLA